MQCPWKWQNQFCDCRLSFHQINTVWQSVYLVKTEPEWESHGNKGPGYHINYKLFLYYFFYHLRIKWTCRKLHFVIFILSTLFALSGKFTDKSRFQSLLQNKKQFRAKMTKCIIRISLQKCMFLSGLSSGLIFFFHKVAHVQCSDAKPTHLRHWKNLKSTTKGHCFHWTSWNSAGKNKADYQCRASLSLAVDFHNFL